MYILHVLAKSIGLKIRKFTDTRRIRKILNIYICVSSDATTRVELGIGRVFLEVREKCLSIKFITFNKIYKIFKKVLKK